MAVSVPVPVLYAVRKYIEKSWPKTKKETAPATHLSTCQWPGKGNFGGQRVNTGGAKERGQGGNLPLLFGGLGDFYRGFEGRGIPFSFPF